MKNISSFSLLNEKPVIYVSDKALEAIKHIVSIAPEEAQWFHVLNETTINGHKALMLSDKLYIPKQNTSAAQVDSTSSMMIEFYNELKAEYTDQTTINEKLTSMTCWCHSHHNMAPNPSSQDQTQFSFFVKSALQQDQTNPQLMLIFNKKNQFYSKLYDPSTGLTYEGLDIVKCHDYDFDYIDNAAKNKFLKPKVKSWVGSNLWNKTARTYPNDFTFAPKEKTKEYENVNLQLADQFISEAYPVTKKLSSTARLKTEHDLTVFVESLEDTFNSYEVHIFYYLLINDIASIKSWFNMQEESALMLADNNYDIVLHDINDYLTDSSTKDRVSHVRNCAYNVFKLVDIGDDQRSLTKVLKEISA